MNPLGNDCEHCDGDELRADFYHDLLLKVLKAVNPEYTPTILDRVIFTPEERDVLSIMGDIFGVDIDFLGEQQ